MADEAPNDGWTFRTFREYVLALLEQFKVLREADRITLNAALAAADRAVAKAEASTEKRFESVNEFRKTLSDQASTFMLRGEADAKIQALTDKLGAIETRIDKSEGSQGGKREGLTDLGNVLGYIIGAVGSLAYIWSLFHTTH